jgi:hypothetical protein
MSKGERRGRLAGEFFLIVLGVVVALGIDRWVQEIDDNRSEREYLERLASDVRANEGIFSSMLQDWEASQKAASDLLGMIEGTSARPSSTGLLVAVARAGATNTGLFRDASFQDLAATGNLRLIRDPELRTDLVHYFGQQIHAGRPAFDRLDLRIRTFSREYLPTEWTRSWRELCPRTTPAIECTTEDPPSTDLIWQALTQDAAMRRILRARENDAAQTVILIQRWLEASEEILAELEEVLDEDSVTG